MEWRRRGLRRPAAGIMDLDKDKVRPEQGKGEELVNSAQKPPDP
jgi:hypothetical protein